MLNDIRQHVDTDEQLQCEQEALFAKEMHVREKKNLEAFSRYIPTIAQTIVRVNCERLSVFVDKSGQSNIVNLSSGVTLYDMPVDENMALQTQSWASFSAMLSLTKDAGQVVMSPIAPVLADDSFASNQRYTKSIIEKCNETLPDAVVVLGLGKGNFLPSLLEQLPLKQVIIYEPDWEIFKCSFMLFDWASFLEDADKKGIQLFLQIGASIENIFDEINELYSQLGTKHLIVYRHILNSVNNNIFKNLRCGRWDRGVTKAPISGTSQSQQSKFTLLAENDHKQHYLKFTNCLQTRSLQSVDRKDSYFVQNMKLFESFYPDIFEAFIDYQPQCWETVADASSGEINLFNRQHQSFYSGDSPSHEGKVQAKHFTLQPNLDGLVFGYEGEKLKHYLHNRFTRKADLLLKQYDVDKSELPKTVKVLLVFGLGSGYMLDALYQDHEIQNLCICEPNPDFFFASLHAIDWRPIFERLQENEGKLYINIGEASSLLFKDLTSQFVSLGPHLLNETYIMQGYANPLLSHGLKEVRQQLQVIFSMGENLDHVMYGIAHSAQAIKDKVPILLADASKKLSIQDRHQAIFIVGNGPSLDESIEIIKEYGEQAIVVSCGTALQSLHRNGICPDFHAEVEQNRANYDWACRIDDLAYLKKISFLSVCGAHPDTYSLYKDAYLVFKVGESSTQAITSMLPEINFESLENAYPTVTNFAASLFLSMGFDQIYLHGVDLGFANPENHHSKSSAYYENGKAVFNNKKLLKDTMTTKGNRAPQVHTKTEFNISRMIFEQSLAQNKAECFNSSNGAYINGSYPLLPEDTLVVNTPSQKQATLKCFLSCFKSVDCDIEARFNQAYSRELMQRQLAHLSQVCKQIIEQDITDKNQIDSLIEQLRALMIDARRVGGSLFFYYMFNSVNYLCAVLSKALMLPDLAISLANCKSILQDWNTLLADFACLMEHQFTLLDTAECLSTKHQLNALKHLPIRVLYFATSDFYKQQCTQYSHEQKEQIITITEHIKVSKNEFLYIDIVDDKKIPALLSRLRESHIPKEYVKHICFVFHDYRHLLKMKSLCADTGFGNACFMYLSLLWQKGIECNPLLSRLCESGYQDHIARKGYFNFLCARARDIPHFSTIMFKPGLAERSMYLPSFSGEDKCQAYDRYQEKIDLKIQFVENISNFDHLYDVNFSFSEKGMLTEVGPSNELTTQEVATKPANMLTAGPLQDGLLEEFELDKAPDSVRDEYQAHAIRVIDNKLSQHIDFDTCYSFKCYCAVVRDSENVPNPQVTMLDSCGNRGLLSIRKLVSDELQAKWYPY